MTTLEEVSAKLESVENEFNIQFSQDDFMNSAFSSINGLAKMIAKKNPAPANHQSSLFYDVAPF